MPVRLPDPAVSDPAPPNRRQTDGPEALEALIEEARRRTRRRRTANATAVVIAGLLGAGVLLLILGSSGGPTSAGRSGRAPAATAPGRSASSSYLYTRTITTLRLSRPAGGEYQAKVFMRARGPMVPFDLRVSTETWVGLDATTRTRTLVLSQNFASARGRREWAAYHRPVPDFARNLDEDTITQGNGTFPVSGPSGDPLGPQGIGDGAFTLRQLRALPSRPSALLRQVNRAFVALERRQAKTALDPCGWGAVAGCPRQPAPPVWQQRATQASVDLGQIAQMLEWPIPQRLRRALLGAATTLPRISSAASVHRGAIRGSGRATTTVTLAPRRYPGRFEPVPSRLVFESRSGRVLQQPGGIVAIQGLTASARALPPGIAPLRPASAPPTPPVVTVSPTVGAPETVFRVTVALPRRSAAPISFGGGVSGPVYPGCRSGFDSPTPPSQAPWLTSRGLITSGAQRLETFRLSPPSGTHGAWCSGRYQLSLMRSGVGPAGASDLGTTIVSFRVR